MRWRLKKPRPGWRLIFSLCTVTRVKTLLFIFVVPIPSQVDIDLLNRWLYLFSHRARITTHIFWFQTSPMFSFLYIGTSRCFSTAKWIYIAVAFPRFQRIYCVAACCHNPTSIQQGQAYQHVRTRGLSRLRNNGYTRIFFNKL